MSRTVLAVFCYGGLHRRAVESLFKEVFLKKQPGINRPVPDMDLSTYFPHDDALISRSRSVTLCDVMGNGYDAVVMVDHDISWETGMARRMAGIAIGQNAVVGGLYGYKAKGKGLPWRAMGNIKHFSIGADELIDAEFLPAGFLAVPRTAYLAAVAALAEHPDPDARIRKVCRDGVGEYWDFFRPVPMPFESGSEGTDGKLHYAGEDWSFCWRMRKAGIPVKAWTAPRLVHWGQYGFGPEDAAPWSPEL